jgi:hypothetical protein
LCNLLGVDGENKEKMEKIDYIICSSLVVLGFFIVFSRVLIVPITSDWQLEYEIYLKEVVTGRWQYVSNSLVNSCLFTTLLPAYLQRAFPLNGEFWFRLVPTIFLLGIPVITYLIARLYLNRRYSVACALFVMSHFYFIVNPFMSKTQVGWFFFALILYGILSKRLILTIASSVCLIFAHYTGAIMAVPVLATSAVYSLTKRDWKPMIPLAILLSIGLTWYSLISVTPREVVRSIILQTLFNTTAIEPVTAAMINWPVNPIQAFYWTLSWTAFTIIWLDILRLLKDYQTSSIMLCLFGMIILTLLLPRISSAYGLARVYYTGLPLLSVALMTGIIYIRKYTHIPTLVMIIPLLLLHPNISPF